MSHDIKKKTLVIQTTDRKGRPHVCKVYDLLMWSGILRGINHEHTVNIRRKREFEERAKKRSAS